MCCEKIFFSLVHIGVLGLILIEITLLNEATAHPLKNLVKTKYHSRNKRDIDILVECETECVPEEEVGDDYDILLYYEDEEINESLDEYARPDYYVENEKSCMYRCQILDMNDTNDVTTEKTESALTVEYTTAFDIDLSTTDGIQPIEKGTVANNSLSIGLRSHNESVNANQIQPTAVDASPTRPPIVLIPKKLKLTVFEVELAEAQLKPDQPTTRSPLKIDATQTEVLNTRKETTTQVPSSRKNDTFEINYKTNTDVDLETGNKSRNIEELSNFLTHGNKKENKTLNDVVVKFENTGKIPNSSQLLVNNHEIKCDIFLTNKYYQNETNTGITADQNYKNVVTKQNSSHIDMVTTEAKSERPLTSKTINEPPEVAGAKSDVFENLKPIYKISSTSEASTEVNINPKIDQVIAEDKKIKTISNPENSTLIQGNQGNKSDSFLKKDDSSSNSSDNLHLNKDINIKTDSIVTETKAESKENVTDDPLHRVNNTSQPTYDNSTMNKSESITESITEYSLPSTETEKPNKNDLNNVDISNYSFHGNFTMKNNSHIPEELEKAIAENIRKVDNTSTVIVNPNVKNNQKVTKLDKVKTEN